MALPPLTPPRTDARNLTAGTKNGTGTKSVSKAFTKLAVVSPTKALAPRKTRSFAAFTTGWEEQELRDENGREFRIRCSPFSALILRHDSQCCTPLQSFLLIRYSLRRSKKKAYTFFTRTKLRGTSNRKDRSDGTRFRRSCRRIFRLEQEGEGMN